MTIGATDTSNYNKNVFKTDNVDITDGADIEKNGFTGYEELESRKTNGYRYSSTDNSRYSGWASQEHIVNDTDDQQLPSISLYLPSWGYSDFMAERLNWQKGLNTISGEIGWFYFRIFFHLNTSCGLFGGILYDENGAPLPAATCAKTYFNMWSGHYPSLAMTEREKSLEYFVTQLNNISNKTPWFFKSISGLDKASIVSLNDPFKDNSLEIKCSEESIDMRLTHLFDYYKFACFDYINLKEILPENLRKFDMSVVVFGVPIRYLDTHAKIKGDEFQARQINNRDNMMTLKMFTFKDCEFDVESMTTGITSEISNENAFELGKNSIKIKYRKVFNYSQNAFTNTIVSDMMLDDNFKSDVSERFNKMSDAFNYLQYAANTVKAADNFVDNNISSKTKFSKWYKMARNAGVGEAYSALIDETEAICQDYYNNIAHNLYTQTIGNKYLKSSELGFIVPHDTVSGSDYDKQKIYDMYHGFKPASSKPDYSNLFVKTFNPVTTINENQKKYDCTHKDHGQSPSPTHSGNGDLEPSKPNANNSSNNNANNRPGRTFGHGRIIQPNGIDRLQLNTGQRELSKI